MQTTISIVAIYIRVGNICAVCPQSRLVDKLKKLQTRQTTENIKLKIYTYSQFFSDREQLVFRCKFCLLFFI